MTLIDPFADLTEMVTLSYRDDAGARHQRHFELREMSRRENDKLMALMTGGVRRLEQENSRLDERVESGEITRDEAIAEGLASSWKTLDLAVCFCLRWPSDGGEPPAPEWIRANLNERRVSALLEIQDRLNGVDLIKKNVLKSLEDLSQLQPSSENSSEPGSPSTTVSQTATALPPTRSQRNSPGAKLASLMRLPSSAGGETKPPEPEPKSPIGT